MPSENTRRIAKNTAMLYIRMLLIMAVTLFTSLGGVCGLGVGELGVYRGVGGGGGVGGGWVGGDGVRRLRHTAF